jgi:hypothetical protein
MDLDRPAQVLPVSAAEKNPKLTRVGAAGSRLIESHMEEISEGGHESYSVMPENLPLGGSEDQSGRVKPHTCFESFCPLGHGGRDDYIVSRRRESSQIDIEGRLLVGELPLNNQKGLNMIWL